MLCPFYSSPDWECITKVCKIHKTESQLLKQSKLISFGFVLKRMGYISDGCCGKTYVYASANVRMCPSVKTSHEYMLCLHCLWVLLCILMIYYKTYLMHFELMKNPQHWIAEAGWMTCFNGYALCACCCLIVFISIDLLFHSRLM